MSRCGSPISSCPRFSRLSPVSQGLAFGVALMVVSTMGPQGVAPSSTSASDGRQRNTPADRSPCPAGGLRDRDRARGARRLGAAERPGNPQVRPDPARRLEAGRRHGAHEAARDRQPRALPRPAAPGAEGGARPRGRRPGRRGDRARLLPGRRRSADAARRRAPAPSRRRRRGSRRSGSSACGWTATPSRSFRLRDPPSRRSLGGDACGGAGGRKARDGPRAPGRLQLVQVHRRTSSGS